ncbi:hypothetical protein AWC38_SpisGene9079 [Stylophora pistillata]|uniref:Uncharacterized protein n=1 Tax=Stylophora pistillata TaxID=50429 RepID=A0A2B4SCM7_STYPI|nr:hypothetical protein AWC38_SpisGene9079 [Stylophora pistillata]
MAESEVSSIMEWAEKNQMTLNLNKTREMLLQSGSLKVPSAPLAIVERKTKLKLLGVTFEDDPVNWDSHIDQVIVIQFSPRNDKQDSPPYCVQETQSQVIEVFIMQS